MSETREDEKGWAGSGGRVGRGVETGKRAGVALEGELQVPNRAPSSHQQRTQKQRSSKNKQRIDDENPAKCTSRWREICKYPTKHPPPPANSPSNSGQARARRKSMTRIPSLCPVSGK
jgi:hypothetical protein